ncbi:hypothetical protein BHU72_14745 [Desulfuribacillus stibiiarsenatis]|uniref:Bacterial type II secretion system protein E domain-containing protein n=1 Tax=Desulfuribacillus stibiiarsenatis TaxID=1390249 RepID=A0A1E5L7I8_9FIRM|nr:hypothetical protein [Desulfuribacillus stibiiarsenatis]OEH86008.1 hypothetical protein BHU72_14745 [Desulfuribacillus stibiiarsenatis]
MYSAAKVLQERFAHRGRSGAVIKKWVNREKAFQLIRQSLENERISELVERANRMDRVAIEELKSKIETKIYGNGISIKGIPTSELAYDYVNATYALDVLTTAYFEFDTEEIYYNGENEIFKIVNNRREHLPIILGPETAQQVLERITRGSMKGKAGTNNPLGNTRLLDGTRVAWSCYPVSETSFNLRKHAPPQKVEKRYYLENEVLSEDVLKALTAFFLADLAGGIIGEGAIGKTTMLKFLLLEMTKEWRRRIIVLERLSELGLKRYLRYYLQPNEFDVLEMEATENQSIMNLFVNTKQRAAQLLVQAEVLGGEEVENMKQLNRSGHSSGFFTGHFFPDQLIEGLAGLAAEYKKLDNTAIEEIDLRKIINISIQMEDTAQYPRKLSTVWEYGPDHQQPIIEWKGGNQYVFHKMKSSTGLRKIEKLKYRFPQYYQHLQEVGLV